MHISVKKKIINMKVSPETTPQERSQLTLKLSKRNAILAQKLREKRNLASRAEMLERLARINFKNYQNFSLEEKFQFAANGYCFRNNPNVPAIEICETTIKTAKGMGKGIIVGKAMKELPPGFIILYSYDRIEEKRGRGIQRHYQVQISGKRYMYLHTQPDSRHKYRLANFINAALPEEAEPEKCLSVISEQNMKKVQCKLQWTTKDVSAATKLRFPAHVIVLDTIPQGNELLMRYGSLHRLKPCKRATRRLCG